MFIRVLALCVISAFLFTITGCEADAKVGDGDAKAKIEIDD